MKLDFNSYPLNIYNQATSKYILISINSDVPNSKLSRLSISQAILKSFVNSYTGGGLLSMVDNISIGIKGEKARKSLSNLIHTQTTQIKCNYSSILKESQLNLMATLCVTDYLCYLESGSWGNGAKNIGKIVIGLFELKNPLNVIAEAVNEVSDKYNDICQIYHIAFLLNIYNACPETEYTIKRLITESLCDDEAGKSSFSLKKRPILFADVPYKSLWDNLIQRSNFLYGETKTIEDLYNPFVKWRLNSIK